MKRILGIFSKKRKCLPLSTIHNEVAVKYKSFKTLLRQNLSALNAIAVLEQLYYSGKPFSLTTARIKYEELLEAVTGIVYTYGTLSGQSTGALMEKSRDLDDGLFHYFNPDCVVTNKRLVVPFEAITSDMKKVVGGKAVNLAAIHNLMGLPVPHAFSITAYAFEYFLSHNRLMRYLKEEFSRVSSGSIEEIEKASARLMPVFLEAQVPPRLEEEILGAYASLEKATCPGVRIALRSSAVGEDDDETSFAGQYETVLNVKAEDMLNAYKRVIASKYTARAITYRQRHGLFDRDTPMCVIGIVMIDSRTSGVLYSVDPLAPHTRPVRINSLWGVGEHLVDGSASPDVFVVDRGEKNIRERHIASKSSRLVSLESGGTRLEEVGPDEAAVPSLDDATALTLADWGLRLEEFFSSPQDVEWALGNNGQLYILQSRPLRLPEITPEEARPRDFPGNPVIFSGGMAASPGIATGRVFIIEREEELNTVPEDAILVSRTASPQFARVIGQVRGMITDIGSVASHMSSVAREFGIPAIVDAGSATRLLAHGDVITMSAAAATVYKGVVEPLVKEIRPVRNSMFNSPVHQVMREILDRIAPLNLTDPESPLFTPEGCSTYHDIIRYTHEMAVRAMFGISEEVGSSEEAVALTTSIPLMVRLIDLCGGLREGLTTCDTITPDVIESIPMQALWRGFAHPGVSWEGTMNIDGGKLASLFSVTATAEFGEPGGGESYALLSRDYLNLSARFAYHFATIDTLCGSDSAQNYISLQFSGGAGSYYGRSLRAQLIGTILERLGFKVALKGDLVEASFPRYDRRTTEERLDLTGRLLASSRLLDMTLSNQDSVVAYAEEFFKGNYDFLLKRRDDELRNFYVQGGHWKRVLVDGRPCCVQDGSRWGGGIASAVSGIMGRMAGNAYHEFLDTIEAYYYFPIAVAKGIELSEGTVGAGIKPLGGAIDRAGGIAFSIKSIDNYFVLRTNALEGNVMLFEYRHGRRIARGSAVKKIESGIRHFLEVVIEGAVMKGFLNGERIIEYRADVPFYGFVGLWTKSDSVICFDEFTLETPGGKRIAFPVTSEW